MKIIEQNHSITLPMSGEEMLKRITAFGHVCYASDKEITVDSAKKFVSMLIKHGHESVLEHCSFTVIFTTSRNNTHELVRHRLASYSQQSQRYVKYDDVMFIRPQWAKGDMLDMVKEECEMCEKAYAHAVKLGLTPQQARYILPNCTATEIVVTANLREWRTILKLRTASDADPEMQALMRPLLNELKTLIPAVFDDIDYGNHS